MSTDANQFSFNTVPSLADTGERYQPVALFVAKNGAQTAITEGGCGLTSKSVKLLTPCGLSFQPGIHVLQARRYESNGGPCGGTKTAVIHIQVEDVDGNRPYGWAFDSKDENLLAIVRA